MSIRNLEEMAEDYANSIWRLEPYGACSDSKQDFLQGASAVLADLTLAKKRLLSFIRMHHGERALDCEHDYEPNTCMTEMRCERCGIDMNLGHAFETLQKWEREP